MYGNSQRARSLRGRSLRTFPHERVTLKMVVCFTTLKTVTSLNREARLLKFHFP